MKNNYQKYMKQCIRLAKLSYGHVSPNPLVGAIVLDKNGSIAGSGRHELYGKAHAEVNAIADANQKGIDISGGTIIVNLEPCSHYGKTPPCADLIIQSGLKKVVIGCVDPNPKVSGNGIKKLEEAGIEVVQGILEKECRDLNEIFIKNQTAQLPFIAIKTAVTMDGKIAAQNGSSKWITSAKAREAVQKLRMQYDAILTGSGTVLADNPSMTCRMKNNKGRNPVRIIIDSELKTIDSDLKIYNNDGTKIYIAISNETDIVKVQNPNIEFLRCPLNKYSGKIDLAFLSKELFSKNICSILVEAGGILNGAFLKENLADKIYQFTAPKIAGDIEAKSFVEGFDLYDINKAICLEIKNVKNYPPDILIEANVKKYIHNMNY